MDDKKTEHKINFLTIADSNYFEPVLLSAGQISKIYPKSKLYIYDWGFEKKQIEKLDKIPNVRIIKWEMKFSPIRLSLNRISLLKILLGISKWKDLIYNLIYDRKKIFNYDNLKKILKSEMFFLNKFLCIKDFVLRGISEKFIFIDGDAFLINKIDEIVDGSIDFGVTIRRSFEKSYKRNNCQLLNAGVILFLGGNKKNKALIESWKKEIEKTDELWIEQTALSRMLYRKNTDVFEKSDPFYDLEFSGSLIRVAVLPCEIYNYNWMEEFNPESDKDKVKVLHFKSGRFNTPLFKEIAHKLNL